jgi:anti-sigma B factor antagonist
MGRRGHLGRCLRTMTAANQLHVDTKIRDGELSLALRGTLDLASAPKLRAIVSELCADGATGITVDLSGLTSIDSGGLNAVLAIDNLCRREGYDFALIRGPRQVHKLFELTGVAEDLPFEDGDPTAA